MTKKQLLIVAIMFAIVASVPFISGVFNSNTCVNVYVDYGSLDNNAKVNKCVPIELSTGALSVLSEANLNIIGTKKYGNKVVCRVNNLPDATKERCLDMPPENAYWAVIIKKRQKVPNPFSVDSHWGWAQTGISDIILQPGDSIGLVFAENGKVKFP